MKLTLDYMVPLTVQIDTETGEIANTAWVHLADALSVIPERVFNRGLGEAGEEEGPEYLPNDHPAYVKAIGMLDRFELTRNQDISVPLTVKTVGAKYKEGDVVSSTKHNIKAATVEGVEEYLPGLFAYHLAGHSLPFREGVLEGEVDARST